MLNYSRFFTPKQPKMNLPSPHRQGFLGIPDQLVRNSSKLSIMHLKAAIGVLFLSLL